MKIPLKRYAYQYWYVGCFVLLGIFFRFYALGVNYFGGDELSTIDYLVHYGKSTPSIQIFLQFLADQDRGPGQYVINFLNISFFGYHNEFQLRFPYFIFSLASIYTLFLLSKYTFKNTTVAVFTAYLISFNGLFIIFGRVAQYQSLLTFLIPLSIYFYFRGFEENSNKYILLSSILYSICLISHFDALSCIVVFGSYFLVKIVRNFKVINVYEDIRKFLIFSISLILQIGSVYVPYLFSDQRSTTNYLGGRIFGRYFLYPNNTYEKLGRILELYMPLESWLIVLLFCFLGLASLVVVMSKAKVKIFKTNLLLTNSNIYLILLTSIALLFIFTALGLLGRSGSLLIFIFTVLLCFILFLEKKLEYKVISLAIWFLTSFYSYFYLFNDPRTHIYVSFIPGFCFAALGFNYLTRLRFSKIYKLFILLIFIIFSVFNTYFYYLVFVDKNPEYLWHTKKFLYKDLPFVNRSNNTGLKLFAFTTNNHFSEIKELFDKNCLIGTYASNEKWETTSFYLDRNQVSLNIKDLPNGPDNIIYFTSPNIWNSLTLKRANSFIEYKLLKIYYTYNQPSVFIFGKLNTYDHYDNPCGL